MSINDKILNAIANTPTPAGEPARELRETRRSMILHDLKLALSRANSLGISVEEVLIFVGAEYTDTHLLLLDEEETTQ